MKQIHIMIADLEHDWLKDKMKNEERQLTDIIRELIRDRMKEDSRVVPDWEANDL